MIRGLEHTPILWRRAEREGVACPGEEKAQRDFVTDGDFFQSLQWQHKGQEFIYIIFRFINMKFFTMELVRHWRGTQKKFWMPLSQKHPKLGWMRFWATWDMEGVPTMAGGIEMRWSLRSLAIPNILWFSTLLSWSIWDFILWPSLFI